MVRLTRTHSSFTLEEGRRMSRDKLAKMIPSHSFTCQDHTDYQLKYYCQQCVIPVCSECIVIYHKDHPVIELSKEIGKNKEAIQQSIEDFVVVQQKLKDVLTSGEKIKGKIKDNKSEIDTIIRRTSFNLQLLLHQREEALLAKNSEIANAKGAHLSLQLEGIQHLLEAITHYQSLTTTSIGEYNDVELLSVAHTLQTRANQLQQQFSETSLELCESPTTSVDINTDELTAKIANLGDVVEDGASPNNTTAEIPSHIQVGKELKVKMVLKDSKGKKFSKGCAIVTGSLTPIEEKEKVIQAKTTDCGDSTYIVSLTPQQLGPHELSLTLNYQSIYGSPFKVCVNNGDYRTLKNPVQTITGIKEPCFIAFSDNGDIFVTSRGDHCIYVYDSSGRQKTTIGSYGTGPLQFNSPSGIAINGDIMYVAEQFGNRIHKITLGGTSLGTFGKEQFTNPWAICIGPDSKIYVADAGNNRIQVFNCDDTLSHIIKWNFACPNGLSFDVNGYLHVANFSLNAITVFTPDGQYVHQYGQSRLMGPRGIVIDPAGYILVVNESGSFLVIFDPNGQCIHSIKGFNTPRGVAIAPDGSIWVADRGKNRLVKY